MVFNAKLVADKMICKQINGEVELEYSVFDLTKESIKQVIEELEKESRLYFTYDEDKEAIETLITELKAHIA